MLTGIRCHQLPATHAAFLGRHINQLIGITSGCVRALVWSKCAVAFWSVTYLQNQLSNCNLSAYTLPTNLTEGRQIKWIVAVNCEATNYQGAGFSVLHHDHLDLKIEIQIRVFTWWKLNKESLNFTWGKLNKVKTRPVPTVPVSVSILSPSNVEFVWSHLSCCIFCRSPNAYKIWCSEKEVFSCPFVPYGPPLSISKNHPKGCCCSRWHAAQLITLIVSRSFCSKLHKTEKSSVAYLRRLHL
jgi:hypothetical protein